MIQRIGSGSLKYTAFQLRYAEKYQEAADVEVAAKYIEHLEAQLKELGFCLYCGTEIYNEPKCYQCGGIVPK
jgi:hypothetical protein